MLRNITNEELRFVCRDDEINLRKLIRINGSVTHTKSIHSSDPMRWLSIEMNNTPNAPTIGCYCLVHKLNSS